MSDTAETTTIPAEISANTDKANEDREEPSEHKPPAPAGGKPGTMENRDAIPTAGGEKLGDKHWGESQIVPDNPKPAAEEAGVSSKEGQPTGEVANNTAKNTGGASSGPQNSGEKQKFTDKVKDKLPFGKKDTN
ncbi:Ca2+-modulated channel polycystin [Lecanosticta acicola]|uniref:Ca2+-modulated channel polycystin n=1 Tax=Lecanosticta acicola TaxID=111012 RepID=A0AAI8Z7X6_9PEZI|nr:Ca2+-modulated channel polycystin [Lecanosticta acicola]